MYSLKIKGINLNSLLEEKNYKFIFLSLIIFLSSLKFFGYVCGFIFLIPFLYLYRNQINNYLLEISFENKIVMGYFSFFIFESFIGSYTLRDPRVIIYWVTFFTVVFLSYILNNYKLKTDKEYKGNYLNVIYKSSQFYFIFYLIMNLISLAIFKNEYEIQNNFWVGSSTAFNISSFFLFLLYRKWSSQLFKISSWSTVNIASFTFLVLVNETRLGQIYLLIFLAAVFCRCVQLKKLINFILIVLICFYSFSFGSYGIKQMRNLVGSNYSYHVKDFNREINHNIEHFKKIKGDIQDKTNFVSGDTVRVYEFLIGIEKFKSSNKLQKLLGTGWYSSRKTINPVRNEMFKNLSDKKLLKQYVVDESSTTHLQGIVSLLLDTGLIGVLYTIFLFSITIKNVIYSKSKFLEKALYFIFLLINFFCLFIGYPWNSMAFLLMILPDGIFCLD